ncbi:hypothetical protein BTTAP_120067 [Brochothrix thermosphacta]|nr:hypothetical protein BTH160X_230019 [Brochothrix thermosphacta]SPP27111.1 hypothetical protein BTTAP_120067 [Brochothrix thermosphacta]
MHCQLYFKNIRKISKKTKKQQIIQKKTKPTKLDLTAFIFIFFKKMSKICLKFC